MAELIIEKDSIPKEYIQRIEEIKAKLGQKDWVLRGQLKYDKNTNLFHIFVSVKLKDTTLVNIMYLPSSLLTTEKIMASLDSTKKIFEERF